jgi:hypothetical protein
VTAVCSLNKSLSRLTFKFYLFERAEAATRSNAGGATTSRVVAKTVAIGMVV